MQYSRDCERVTEPPSPLALVTIARHTRLSDSTEEAESPEEDPAGGDPSVSQNSGEVLENSKLPFLTMFMPRGKHVTTGVCLTVVVVVVVVVDVTVVGGSVMVPGSPDIVTVLAEHDSDGNDEVEIEVESQDTGTVVVDVTVDVTVDGGGQAVHEELEVALDSVE